jgi:4a-hydroxytetrahydrobiopterin dehydratase
MDWTAKKCVPCEGGVPKLEPAAVEQGLRDLDGWQAREGHTQIHRHYRFKDFKEAMRFVNAIAEVAEAEGHHPDFNVHSWNCVEVTLWTHAIGGLSENDFIVAAKVGALPEAKRAV